MKRALSVLLGLVTYTSIVHAVYAHVVVKPPSTKVGERVIFGVSVPNEKDVSTVDIRLIVPAGITSVTPNVKPGWTIETKQDKNGMVNEIHWSGGAIAPGLRDDFLFSAQVPSKPVDMTWKAYQTYADGTTVSWDRPASDNDEAEGEGSGPASHTVVADDLANSGKTTARNDSVPSWIAYISLLFSAMALLKALNRNRT